MGGGTKYQFIPIQGQPPPVNPLAPPAPAPPTQPTPPPVPQPPAPPPPPDLTGPNAADIAAAQTTAKMDTASLMARYGTRLALAGSMGSLF